MTINQSKSIYLLDFKIYQNKNSDFIKRCCKFKS